MLCLFKNHITSFGLFCFLFLSVLVSLFQDTNVSALEISKSYNLNDSYTTNDPIFSNCSDYDCLKQFNYLIIEKDGRFTTPGISITTSYGTTNITSTFTNLTFFVYDLDYSNSNLSNSFLRFSRTGTFEGSITYTLTDSLSNCPVCPDPEPDPDPEDCPEVPVNPYDDKLDNITQAIYVATATLLVIYFFYCIYRMIIKGVK